MSRQRSLEVVREYLFHDMETLRSRLNDTALIERVLRVRTLYNALIDSPSVSDRKLVAMDQNAHGVSKSCAYNDLACVKALLPTLHQNAREWHRWRYNEMIMKTYRMAEARKDTKTMERAATSYAKYNRVEVEDATELPFDLIVVQPFTATDDPSVLGIKRMPDAKERIRRMIEKYTRENADIQEVEYEEADLEERELFGEPTGEEGLL